MKDANSLNIKKGSLSKGPCFHAVRNEFVITTTVQNDFIAHSCIEDVSRCTVVQHDMKMYVTNPDIIRLSVGGRRILETPNAGGTSVWSEVMSFEIMAMLFNAKLMRTEMELEYWPPNSKITDFSISFNNETIGVSVTRAMKFKGEFTTEDAKHLLHKKLFGVVCSSQNIIKEHSWKKQILHVWTEHQYIADILSQVYQNDISTEMKSNTLVIITCVNNASWIFK